MVRFVAVAALSFLAGAGLWVANASIALPASDAPLTADEWSLWSGEGVWYAHLEFCEYENEKDWRVCMRRNGLEPNPTPWNVVPTSF